MKKGTAIAVKSVIFRPIKNFAQQQRKSQQRMMRGFLMKEEEPDM
jgi:hypothetical protein